MLGVAVLCIVAMPVAPAMAAPAPELVEAVRGVFPPAEHNPSLVSSQVPLDMTQVRGFAVIKKSGIPAGQAYWFIARQDYEYRPLIVKDQSAKTYHGKIDVSLDAGTVMVVADTEVYQKTVQIKLLSKDVIAAKGGAPTKRDTRAGVALTFKFPKLKMSAEDANVILERIQEYVAPAGSLAQAEQVAAQIRAGRPVELVRKYSVPTPTAAETKATPPSAAPPVAVPPPVSKSAGVVRAGMSYDQVKQISGEPLRTSTKGSSVIFDYGSHEVIFQQEKVSDIRWK